MRENIGKVCIGILDSGVGGLTTLYKLKNKIGYDKIIYLSDVKNLPFGNKSKDELNIIAEKNVQILIDNGANIILFACNTLSTVVLEEISKKFPIKFFGVFPPINMIKGKTAIFATPATVATLDKNQNLDAYPLPNLAADIEKNIFNLNVINLNHHLQNVNKSYKTIILGCTHYNFLAERFKEFFKAKIVSGDNITVNKIFDYLKTSPKKRGEIIFIGENAKKNNEIFSKIY